MSFTTLVEKVEFSRWGMSSVFIISYFWSKNQKQWENFPPWAPQHKLLMLTILVVLFIYLFFPQAKKNFILINMQIVSVRITTI